MGQPHSPETTRALLLRFSLRAQQAGEQAAELSEQNAQLRKELEAATRPRPGQYELREQAAGLSETVVRLSERYEQSQAERAKDVALIGQLRQRVAELEAEQSRAPPDTRPELAASQAEADQLKLQVQEQERRARCIVTAANADGRLWRAELQHERVARATESARMGEQDRQDAAAAAEAHGQLGEVTQLASELAAQLAQAAAQSAAGSRLNLRLVAALGASARRRAMSLGFGRWRREWWTGRLRAALTGVEQEGVELVIALRERLAVSAELLQAAESSQACRDLCRAQQCAWMLLKTREWYRWRQWARQSTSKRLRREGAMLWRARRRCMKQRAGVRQALNQWRQLTVLRSARALLKARAALKRQQIRGIR